MRFLVSLSALKSRLNTDRFRALAAMLFAAILFSLMGAFTKAATRAVPGLPALSGGEMAFFRYLFGLATMLTLAWISEVSLWGEDRRGLFWRGLYGGIAATCYFFSIGMTSLTHAMLLNYTSIIWAPIAAVVVLHERLGKRGVAAILIALAGILLVTRPQIGQVQTGDVVALASGILSGAAIVQIRRLRQGETPFAIFFYFNLFGLPMALIAMWLTRTSFVLPAWSQWPWILGTGLTSVSAQLLMTYGYREVTAAQGSLIALTSVPYTAVLALFLFQEPIPWTTLLGGGLILLSAVSLCIRAPLLPRRVLAEEN